MIIAILFQMNYANPCCLKLLNVSGKRGKTKLYNSAKESIEDWEGLTIIVIIEEFAKLFTQATFPTLSILLTRKKTNL